MTKLNKVQGENIFSGPAVLATITGKSTDECANILARIKNLDNGSQVTGVKPHEMIEAFKKLRFDVEDLNMSGSSLFSSIHMMIARGEGNYYVGLPTHCIVIEVDENRKAFFNDNHTKEPIKAEMSARLMQKVTGAWKVVAKKPLELINEELIIKQRYIVKGGIDVDVMIKKTYNDEEANEEIKVGYLRLKENEIRQLIEKLNKLEVGE